MHAAIYWGEIPPWDTPSEGSDDGFNSCSILFQSGSPNNLFGWQYPHSGNGYIGGGFFGTDGREYAQVQLDSPLVANEKYCVSYYVSLAASVVGLACNNLGAYFSANHIYSPTGYWLPYIPQINDTAIVSDTTNWTLIYGQFIAQGGERYLIIGNFYNDSSTNTAVINSTLTPWAYYYIDDVNVHCYGCDSTTSIHSGMEVLYKGKEIVVSPTPFINTLTVQTNNYEQTEIILYDLSSRKLLQQTFTNTTTINTEQLAKGMYLYEVRNRNGIIKNGKVIKQ